MRDSLREEANRNLEENVTEHEVITEIVICNDSVKVGRITDRTTVRDRSASAEVKKEAVRAVHDTVFVQRADSVYVETLRQVQGDNDNRPSAFVLALKWIFWIIVAIGVMIIMVRIRAWP